MFGSEILEVAIGLFFVYILLSFIATAMREALESWMKTRATDLWRGISELLQDPSLVEKVYKHPLVYGLYSDGYEVPAKSKGLWPSRTSLPSYIPSANFALALLDLTARPVVAGECGSGPETPPLTLAGVRESVASVPNESVRRMLLTAIDRADGDFARAQANVEAWFNSSMDRVSGWYKRRTQVVLFGIGLAVTLLINANSIVIARYLYENDTARTMVVAKAEVLHDQLRRTGVPDTITDSLRIATVAQLDTLAAAGLPIGWNGDWPGWVVKNRPSWEDDAGRALWELAIVPIVGWLATAFAVSLGAPFWFDLLNKVMVIRSTVKPHEKSPPEASEDRQRATSPPPPHLGGRPEAPAATADPRLAASTAGAPAGSLAAGDEFTEREWETGRPREGVV